MKVCHIRDAPFFFVDYKNRLIFLSCDILRISLIYVFATSKYSYCKLIKQSNQSIHTFFSHFCTHLFYGRFYKFNLSLANSQNLIKATANVILLSQI